MKKSFQVLMLTAGLLASLLARAGAQDTSSYQPNAGPYNSAPGAEAKFIVLTGCLRRGVGADTYSIHSGDSLWELKSNSVNLGGHLDQIVIITAVKTGDVWGTLNVIDLRVDTYSCSSW